jgi:hypothetical protein
LELAQTRPQLLHRGDPPLDEVGPELKLPRRRLYPLEVALGIAHLEDDLLALGEPQIPETFPWPFDGLEIGAALEDDAYAIRSRLRLVKAT